MEGLTPAEMAVVLAELDGPDSPDRSRIEVARLPSSTYHVARRRLLAEGWLTTHAVPSPPAFGVGRVEVAFIRPTLSERDDLLGAWSRRPECVALFSGLHSAVGVFWSRDTEASGIAQDSPRAFVCSVDPAHGGLPVYFDLSGAWARFGGKPRPARYPRGLELRGEPASERERSLGRAALGPGTPELGGPAPTQNPRTRSSILGPALWLDLRRVPPYAGRRLGEVIYVTGRSRAGTAPLRLLNALNVECSVFPFLYAWSADQIQFGGLGQISAAGTGRRPVSLATGPVRSTLLRYLDPVEVTIEPVEALEMRWIHRYGPALDSGRRPRLDPAPGADLEFRDHRGHSKFPG